MLLLILQSSTKEAEWKSVVLQEVSSVKFTGVQKGEVPALKADVLDDLSLSRVSWIHSMLGKISSIFQKQIEIPEYLIELLR